MSGLRELRDRLAALRDPQRLQLIGTTVVARQKQRIFTDGKKADGSGIGKYSSKPLYVSPAQAPKAITPEGKTGRRRFKSGKPHKTKYYAGGYKAFRADVGRQSDKIDLDLSSRLRFSYQMETTPYQIKLGFTSPTEAKKARGIENRFGNIFGLTDSEKQLIVSKAL